MHILVLVPAFILFLYFIYKLVRDDYVFIRKNISMEQMFDIAFVVTWASLFFSRLFYFIFNDFFKHNIFLQFFSPQVEGLSLFGALVGGLGTLYLFAKYKRIPFGRLFDVFTLALVVALPLGFIGSALLEHNFHFIASLGNALVYLIFAIFCVKYVHPKLNSRELKEGNVQIIFLLFFSIVLFINATMLRQEGKITLISVESIVLFLFFVFSFILFLRQARSGFLNKKR